jgi:hypothetical protein
MRQLRTEHRYRLNQVVVRMLLLCTLEFSVMPAHAPVYHIQPCIAGWRILDSLKPSILGICKGGVMRGTFEGW